MTYINPFTDFGFKKLFGSEHSRELLISFLNDLLDLPNPIAAIEYRNLEQLGAGVEQRSAIFDVYCTDTEGRHFIVEMQKAEQDYFVDRTLFYATFPIQSQARTGKGWNFELTAVYCIGILDFSFQDSNHDYLHTVNLKNQHNDIFFDKLTLVYLELPNFKKSEHELTTHLDKWLYFVKHLNGLDSIPAIFKDEQVIRKGFDIAELAHMDSQERSAYEESLKHYRDITNVIDTAHRKGKAKGRAEGRAKGRAEGRAKGKAEGKAEGRAEVARNMLAQGFGVEQVAQATGLTAGQIEKLKGA